MKKYLHLIVLSLIAWLGIAPSHAQMTAPSPFAVSGRLCAADLECKTDSTRFLDTLTTATGWRWNFGDPTSMSSNSSVQRNPKHLFRAAGTYNVQLIRTRASATDTLNKMVTIGALPREFPNWRQDTTICKGEKIDLDPYPIGAPAGAKYLWFPKGDTTKVLKVDSAGCYSVEVTLPNGCSYEDKVQVKVCGQPEEMEGAKWHFGAQGGLDFSGGSPRPLNDSNINTPEGSASISNNLGKLLFYTDGIRIFDRDGAVMPSRDTTKLGGSPNSTQSALIIPQPPCRGCEYLYYVITTSEINGRRQLNYSLVDMRRNGGKGEVVSVNTLLQSPTTERITSVMNDRDSTYWIVSHDYGNNTFRIFHATQAGLQQTSVVSLGQAHNTAAQAEGYMKFSPRDSAGLRKLAVIIPGPPQNKVQLFTFNDSTGRLTGGQTIDLGPAPPKAYGVEFSPDGSKMYVSFSGNGTTAAPSRLWQYDLSLGDSARIADSKIQIDSSATRVFGALQMASDGKIYLAIKDSNFLGVINDPDEDSQQEVRFVMDGINLGRGRSQLGLPNFIQNFTMESDMFTIQYSDTCSNRPTNFEATPACDPLKNSFSWDFGDGSMSVPMPQPKTTHTYKNPGTYIVKLRQTILRANGGICMDTTIVQPITILKTPDPFTLPSPIDTCVNVLSFDPKVDAERYLWIQNGRPIARTRALNITNAQSGTYQLIAANGSQGQCPSRAQTQVTLRRPPAINLGRDTALCVGGTGITLAVTEMTWREFKWSTGATTPDLKVTQPGLYSVTVTNANKCVNSDTVRVTALPKPQIQVAMRAPTGCLTRDGSITVTVNPSGTYQFRWVNTTPMGAQPSSTTNVANNVAQGKYRVYIAGTANTCAADSLLNLESRSNVRVDTTIVNARCTQPRSGLISLSTLNGNPQRYAWTNAAGMPVGGNTAVLRDLTPGKYNVKITDDGGCETELTNIVVGMTQEKFIALGPDRLKCVGDTVLLDPRVVAVAGNVFAWSTGETLTKIVVKQAGTYTLTVNNPQTGCKDSDNINIGFAARPQYDLTKDVPICTPDGGTAFVTITARSPNLKYFWPRSQEITPRIRVNTQGSYVVQIGNPEGCTVQDTARVFVACEPRIYVPDAFSPNGDSQNDQLAIYGAYYTDFELRVFNRWGEVVFETNDINQKWDGRYRGILYPAMVYPYTVTFGSKYYPDRVKTIQRGAILLVR